MNERFHSLNVFVKVGQDFIKGISKKACFIFDSLTGIRSLTHSHVLSSPQNCIRKYISTIINLKLLGVILLNRKVNCKRILGRKNVQYYSASLMPETIHEESSALPLIHHPCFIVFFWYGGIHPKTI